MLAKPILRWLLPFVVVGGSYAGYAAIAATAPEKSQPKMQLQNLLFRLLLFFLLITKW